MDIHNSIAIVTGGGSGLGAATAHHLAKAGARVALLDINLAQAENVAKAIDGLALACDVSDENSVKAALAQVQAHYGAARIVVNCAGIVPGKRIVGREGPMPLADFSQVIHVNLIGTFNVLRLAAFAMSQLAPLGDSAERGVIINTASIAAYEGQIGQAAYSASKSGIVGLTLPAARELAQFGIRVIAIAPGIMATPMIMTMPTERQASLSANIPFPQRLGQPSEFAKLVLHIIDNAFINGETIRLDGALRMQAK